MLSGLWLNVRLLVCCAVGALALGLVIAVLRTLRGPIFFPVRALAAGYTYTFRGLPLIIVLYLLTLGVPGLRLQGMPPVLVLGGLALVLTYGGYLAEVFRAGIESVHPSQLAAARSLGLTYRQTMRHVVLPQAVRRVAPPCSTMWWRCRRTSGWSRSPGRSTRSAPPRSPPHSRSTTPRTSWPGCSSCCSRSR
ncbi:hypothetical protein GCM10027614_77440 [Micromonospora vulcania]